MVKVTIKHSFASLPPTTRATALVLGGDPKGKNFLYCSGNSVVIRDIENPINHDSYYDHQKTPSCAKYSPSGFYICSGDATGKVRIWDTTQLEHILKYEYQPLSGIIKDISWDADSKRIAVCGEGREKYAHAFLWDSGSSIGKLDGIGKSANSVDIKKTRPYRCAVASEDYSVYGYEGPPFKNPKTLEGGDRFSNCARFSPDGKYLATSNSDGNIRLYDGKTFDSIGVFGEPKSHQGGVYSICFSPDGSELLSASADKSCKIWNVESRQMLVEFVIGKDVTDQQLSCLWQGEYILSVSLSGEINYLDRNDPSKPSRVLSGHNKSIGCATVKHGQAIFTASFDGNIVRWDPNTGDAWRFKGKGHNAMVKDMGYLPSSNQVVSIGLDNKLRYTDADSREFSADTVVALESEPASLAVTDDDYIVVACEKEVVLIKDGKKLSALSWDVTHPAQLSARGTKIVASGKESTGFNKEGQNCRVYDIDNNTISDTNVSFDVSKSVSAVSFSPDASRVAVANQKEILVYELSDGFEKKPKSFIGNSNNCKAVAWSPNGRYIATGSVDSSIWIFDADGKAKTSETRAHPKSVIRSVVWLDDNTLVSVGEQCMVKQWSVSF